MSGGLYLSSNDGQIRGHIDNLRARFNAEYRHPGFRAILVLVTTADVVPSPGMKKYAENNVRSVVFSHIHAEYAEVRKPNGKVVWYFRFVKKVSK